MPEASALGPIDPASIQEVNEEEKAAPWIVRKLVGVSGLVELLLLSFRAFHVPEISCPPVLRPCSDRSSERRNTPVVVFRTAFLSARIMTTFSALPGGGSCFDGFFSGIRSQAKLTINPSQCSR
ncbi:hypothetical protein BDZ97DRAFT_194604 [Flammula alnicola]|nr:hypothetical protein BDZ97DRAFT_194604 [Flammula alnicola]